MLTINENSEFCSLKNETKLNVTLNKKQGDGWAQFSKLETRYNTGILELIFDPINFTGIDIVKIVFQNEFKQFDNVQTDLIFNKNYDSFLQESAIAAAVIIAIIFVIVGGYYLFSRIKCKSKKGVDAASKDVKEKFDLE